MKHHRRWALLLVFTSFLLVIVGCSPPEATPYDSDSIDDGESNSTATEATAGEDDTSSEDGTSSDDTAVEAIPASLQDRYLRVVEVSGEVSISLSDDGNPREVLAGELVPAGATLMTGSNGEVILELDDGTLMVISHESIVTLEELEGSTLTPITRFFMNIGEIFAFREDSPPLGGEASFDIETPQGIAAIRGSSLNVRFRVIDPDQPEDGEMVAICLSGHCAAQGNADAAETTLEGENQTTIDPSGRASTAEVASTEDLERGQATQQRAEEATKKTERIALCHDTGDPATPYIELHINYNAADGHGHEDHAGDIVPIPANGCPSGETATAGTPEPTGTSEPVVVTEASGDGGGAGAYDSYTHLGGMTYGICGPETVSAGLVYIEVGAGCGDDYDVCVAQLSGTVPVITVDGETVPLWANGVTRDGIQLETNGVSAVVQTYGNWGKAAVGTITLEPGTYEIVYSWPRVDGTSPENYCTLTVVEP